MLQIPCTNYVFSQNYCNAKMIYANENLLQSMTYMYANVQCIVDIMVTSCVRNIISLLGVMHGKAFSVLVT